MTWLIILLGLIIIGVLVYFIWFKPKGTPIFVERWSLHGAEAVCLDAKKPIIGYQRRNEDGAEVIVLPSKYSKVPIQGVDSKYINYTTAGIPKVRLLRTQEQIYYPLGAVKVKDDQVTMDMVVDNKAIAFYVDEIGKNEERYANKKSNWEKFAPLAGFALVAICFIIGVIFITRFAGDQIDQVREESYNQAKSDADRILDVVRGINRGDASTSTPTNAPRPIGNTDSNTATT